MMTRIGVSPGLSAVMFCCFAGVAYAADSDIIVTKAPPAEVTKAPPTPATCGSVLDFIATNCPLTWYGITLYGTIDAGVTWQSHGVPFNGTSAPGEEYLISKNSNRALWGLAPNGLTQSNVGIRGSETFVPGWAFVFDVQAAFDPYSLQLANGPGSVAQNAGVPLTSQNTNNDSSRAGQFYNNLGYLGVSSDNFGTLTVFRQNALTLDGVLAYDPMGASYAFSAIGYQGMTCGVGDTETCKYTTSLKYRLNLAPIRAAALWQFGGYDQNNASTGAWEGQIGGDISNLANGELSLDAIGSYVQNAVAITLTGNPVVAGVPVPPYLPQTLTATVSNDASVMLLAKYTNGPIKLYAGYEWIQYAPPSETRGPFTDIAGDLVSAVNTVAFDFHDKILQVLWIGAKYAVTGNLDVIAAYYHYEQNSYGGGASSGCTNSTFATCSGTLDAVSVVLDWRFAAKFDAYAGFMFSQVNAGLSNGFLNRNTIDPTVGLRFRF